jgi:hypothetical protein
MDPDPRGPDLRVLERAYDRLQARAEEAAAGYARARERLSGVRDFLELAPRAASTLEELSQALFGEALDEIETNLTHAIREILGQDREVRSVREVKNNRLHVQFQIMNQGQAEDVLVGQGGSVCNILSVSLRLIALSRLDEARHRPFLVLDEQDCWLRPDLVPKFMKIIAQIAKRLSIQALVISHHPLDLFQGHAGTIYRLRPSRESGVALERIQASEKEASSLRDFPPAG